MNGQLSVQRQPSTIDSRTSHYFKVKVFFVCTQLSLSALDPSCLTRGLVFAASAFTTIKPLPGSMLDACPATATMLSTTTDRRVIDLPSTICVDTVHSLTLAPFG